MVMLFNNDNVRGVSVRRVAPELVVIGRFGCASDSGGVIEELVVREPDRTAGRIHAYDAAGERAVRNVDLAARVCSGATVGGTAEARKGGVPYGNKRIL